MDKPYVLTIDDDLDFCTLLQAKLKNMGIDGRTTNEPKEFLSQLKTKLPDLCIIDLNLDKYFGAGFQLIQAIRKNIGFHLPLFVMSKRSSREDVAYALELGANEYITKPLDELILQAKIKQYIKVGASDSLNFFNVPRNKTNCDFHINLKIREVTEFGITLTGDYFLAKNTPCQITGSLINEIVGRLGSIILTVSNCLYESENETFATYLDFDPYDEKMCLSVRRWLTENQQIRSIL